MIFSILWLCWFPCHHIKYGYLFFCFKWFFSTSKIVVKNLFVLVNVLIIYQNYCFFIFLSYLKYIEVYLSCPGNKGYIHIITELDINAVVVSHDLIIDLIVCFFLLLDIFVMVNLENHPIRNPLLFVLPKYIFDLA